ncbi:MAG TPA: hypothetical protein VF003_01830 [Pseudonocardiaceae bacterium]
MLTCSLRLVRAGSRRYATYRQAVLAGLATKVVFGFIDGWWSTWSNQPRHSTGCPACWTSQSGCATT